MIKIMQFTGSRHVGAWVDNYYSTPTRNINMVICVVIGCSPCFVRDKWLTFHRFPVLTKRFGEKDFELRKKHLDGYLAAVSREDITPNRSRSTTTGFVLDISCWINLQNFMKLTAQTGYLH